MSHLFEFPWSDFYNKLRVYGATFIDNARVDYICMKTHDDHAITHRSMNTEIPEWIRDVLPVKPEILQVFVARPGKCGKIHMDGIDRRCALNIPVSNCALGKMEWFDDEFPIQAINNNYTRVRLTGLETTDHRLDSEPVYSCRLTSPSLVNTSVWHRIDNRENDQYRYVLSLRFLENPSFEDMLNYLVSSDK